MSGYLGSKAQPNVWRRIVSLIPPHDVLIVPFAGHCAVARRIRPCRRLILVDADSAVCDWWLDGRLPNHAELHCCDGIEFLRHWFGLTRCGSAVAEASACGKVDRPSRNPAASPAILQADPKSRTSATEYFGTGPLIPATTAAGSSVAGSGVAVYCDPPYLLSTRTSGHRYRCEMTNEDHRRLLEVASRIAATPAAVLVSGYQSAIYDARLGDWIRKEFTGMTRGGARTECVWINRQPSELHDYRWHGRDKREREKLKRREDSIRKKLREMKPIDRQRFLAAVAAEFGDPAESPDSATVPGIVASLR